MTRRRILILLAISLLVIAGIALLVRWGLTSLFTGAVPVSPRDIVINELSTAGADWVTLYNTTDRTIDISGFILTDGDGRYAVPNCTSLPPKGEIVFASAADQEAIERIGTRVNHYWGSSLGGFSRDGEMVILLNSAGSMVLDYIIAPPLNEWQILQRHPIGTGDLLVTTDGQPQQNRRPEQLAQPKNQSGEPTKYYVVSTETITAVTALITATVTFFSALSGGLTTLLSNLHKLRDNFRNLTQPPAATESDAKSAL